MNYKPVPSNPIRLEQVEYSSLKSRQQETYNFHKVASALAEFGYNSIRLSDDWMGADFIAYHNDGDTFYRVQLKGRITFDQKYLGKGIYVAALHKGRLYVYPHDEAADLIDSAGKMQSTKSWIEKRSHSWPNAPKWLLTLLEKYEVPLKNGSTISSP